MEFIELLIYLVFSAEYKKGHFNTTGSCFLEVLTSKFLPRAEFLIVRSVIEV